ncbi:MAG: PrsW family glutamic-type intramembrane protease [Methanocellales archaeon]|nr:PrsW family glutamic-type intramembrane protease [Methanocellales archaeon]MDD3420799.1 PrsW family glutamic-type intramembrane protease [Methanocellales archaeon]MDD4898641.1 PrsW family glutamic-type intramembrane protease [Methanocellales archaeon]MDD5447518.1 PrsW family glutamic-type intramembrane protease [Methanocellales archaeon]
MIELEDDEKLDAKKNLGAEHLGVGYLIEPHKPDLREKLFFFISGFVISVPLTLYIGLFTDNLCAVLPKLYAEVCAVSIFAPFIEEFAKVYPLFYRHGESKRSVFTLGFLVGLGFGISEFFVYIVTGAPIAVRLPLMIFHAASASITAYGIATKRPLQFYLLAVLIHGLNNFSAFFDSFWFIGGIGAIVIGYSLSWSLYRKTSENFVD